MRKHKRVIAQFSFHDRTGISSYLEKMALRGWMLEKTTKLFWHFRRIEPKRIHFAISYFAKTSSFEPEAPEALVRFREFCQHSGWIFCAEAAQMQIFYNETENPIPIETDALLEIESIHKGMKKQQIPAYILILIAALLNGFTRVFDLIKNPITFLKSNLNLFVMFSVVIILIMVAAELGGYFIWRARALKAARRDGSFIPTRGNRILIFILLYLLIAALLLLILAERNSYFSAAILICIGYYFAILILVHGISALMKHKKVDAGTNVTVTIIVCVVLSFAMIGTLTWTVSRLSKTDFFKAGEDNFVLAPDELYSGSIGSYVIHHHEMPLYASDFADPQVPDEAYSNFRRRDRSILMEFNECYSQIRKECAHDYLNMGPTKLSYDIYDIKLPFLADVCLRQLLSLYNKPQYEEKYEYRPMDPKTWNADEVYRLYGSNYELGQKTPRNEYIIRWGQRIVGLHLLAEPTEEQIAVIAEKLGS